MTFPLHILTTAAGHLADSAGVLADASRPWLVVAALAFLGAFLCTVAAWRAAMTSAGARLCPRRAAACLGVGSLVNAVAPAKLGDAVKVALCARAMTGPGRAWAAGGAYAALTATRSLTLAALVIAASATGAMPVWPVFVLLGGVGLLVLAAAVSRRFRSHAQVARLLDGTTALIRAPRSLAAVVGWTVGMQLARICGTLSVTLAFGLPHPLLAALVILPALDVAGAIPLTPGSIGIGSGAVAVALASRGIGMTQALGVGLAIQAVETAVSFACGSLGLAYLLRPDERARRVARRAAVVAVAASLATLVGLAVFDVL